MLSVSNIRHWWMTNYLSYSFFLNNLKRQLYYKKIFLPEFPSSILGRYGHPLHPKWTYVMPKTVFKYSVLVSLYYDSMSESVLTWIVIYHLQSLLYPLWISLFNGLENLLGENWALWRILSENIGWEIPARINRLKIIGFFWFFWFFVFCFFFVCFFVFTSLWYRNALCSDSRLYKDFFR